MKVGDTVRIQIPPDNDVRAYRKFDNVVGPIVNIVEVIGGVKLVKISGTDGGLWPIEWVVLHDEIFKTEDIADLIGEK